MTQKQTDAELAKAAYERWDTYGGRALGSWGAPYTEDAWIEVVKLVRSTDAEAEQ